MFRGKAWIGAITATGLAIAVVAVWVCFTYGNVLAQILELPNAALVFGGVFLLALIAMVLRGLVSMFRRWRRDDRAAPTPGGWAFAWVSVQMACLLALLMLGAAAVAALPLGHTDVLFQAFMLVLVASALLSLTGGAVREFARVARSLG